MDVEVSTHTFLTMIIKESVCFMSCEPFFFFLQLFLCSTHGIYFYLFFINWTLRMSDNLPERVQILCHAHIICITVLENRIICCQIFCDLLLKSAFERIFNAMQLILVKIKWHIISDLASSRHFPHWPLIFESNEYLIHHLNFQKILLHLLIKTN
jgi:hypothetical protein